MSEERDIIHAEFAELVNALRAGGLHFLLVGGLSLLAHHVERATGDIDFFCKNTAKGQVQGILLGIGYSVMHENPALFVSLQKPHKRLQISGIEVRLREYGKRLGLSKVHPHKFRRTLATMAIDKGMPIEQVQVLLGHKKIDTTLRYAMVDQRNVKASHRRYLT